MRTAIGIFAIDRVAVIEPTLLDAYEAGQPLGKKLAAVRRMLDIRARAQGRGLPAGRLGRKGTGRRMTAHDLMQVYQREAEKQRS